MYMLSAKEREQLLRDAPPKSWIALSGDESRLVAAAPSYEEAVEKAEAAGENDPILIMAPDSWHPLVLSR
jgi:hypothetical protein